MDRRIPIYLRAKELIEKPDDVRVVLLLNCVGQEARERYNHFAWDADSDNLHYDKVIQKFDDHFQGKKHLVFSTYKFWSHEQSEDQDLMDYVTTLRTLACQCELTEKDNMIRDKLVFSLKDKHLKERLLEVDNLSLQTTIEKCQAAETNCKEISIMTDGIKEESMVVEAVKIRKKKILTARGSRTVHSTMSELWINTQYKSMSSMGQGMPHVSQTKSF